MNKNLKRRAERWLAQQAEDHKKCTSTGLGLGCPACRFELRAAKIIKELMKAAK